MRSKERRTPLLTSLLSLDEEGVLACEDVSLRGLAGGPSFFIGLSGPFSRGERSPFSGDVLCKIGFGKTLLLQACNIKGDRKWKEIFSSVKLTLESQH